MLDNLLDDCQVADDELWMLNVYFSVLRCAGNNVSYLVYVSSKSWYLVTMTNIFEVAADGEGEMAWGCDLGVIQLALVCSGTYSSPEEDEAGMEIKVVIVWYKNSTGLVMPASHVNAYLCNQTSKVDNVVTVLNYIWLEIVHSSRMC